MLYRVGLNVFCCVVFVLWYIKVCVCVMQVGDVLDCDDCMI